MDSPSTGGRMFSPSLSARPRASSSSLHQVYQVVPAYTLKVDLEVLGGKLHSHS
jgi:hypothetical protein